MNQRPQGLKVEKATAGFLQYKSAEGLAPVTVTGYERDLKLWIEHMGDVDVSKINSQHVLTQFINKALNFSKCHQVIFRVLSGPI